MSMNIPENVYFGMDTNYFYDSITHKNMGDDFFHNWFPHRELFPVHKTIGEPISKYPELREQIKIALEKGEITVS